MRGKIYIFILGNKVYIMLFQKLYKFEQIGGFAKEPIYLPYEEYIHFSIEDIFFESRKGRSFTHFTCSGYSLIHIDEIVTRHPSLIFIRCYERSEDSFLTIESIAISGLIECAYSQIFCNSYFTGCGFHRIFCRIFESHKKVRRRNKKQSHQ